MTHFSKMHGLGNDFVVINTLNQQIDVDQLPISQLADRHLGIGFDQLLLISHSPKADFFCRIVNGDGSEAEQCGNGLRCVARFIHDKQLSSSNSFSIATSGGVYSATVIDNHKIQISMGVPSFEPKQIPFITQNQQNAYQLKMQSDEADQSLFALSMGNPHAIVLVQSVANFPVQKLGYEIGHHAAFPQGVNVGFMEIVNPAHVRLRTYERGVGETLACGSNSCAAVVAGIANNLLDQKVKVELALGDLWVEWAGEKEAVLMTGPAEFVFEGTF
ncbi:MAG: diaminopimelate epimerase [Gammaproteobacteria bacterium]|nr:diaminopimelate epimerase [Gammaproteobacteria bacterium]